MELLNWHYATVYEFQQTCNSVTFLVENVMELHGIHELSVDVLNIRCPNAEFARPGRSDAYFSHTDNAK